MTERSGQAKTVSTLIRQWCRRGEEWHLYGKFHVHSDVCGEIARFYEREPRQKMRVLLLGDGAVGKTSLVGKFLGKDFFEDYDPTIEEYFTKQVEVDGESVVADVVDLGGGEQFHAFVDQQICGANCFLLVYAVNRADSLRRTPDRVEQILRFKEDEIDQISVGLIGNKCDLESQRQVTTEQAAALTERWNRETPGLNAFHMETSAKERTNVERAFVEVFRRKMKKEGRLGHDLHLWNRDQADNGSCCVIL